MHNLHLCGDSLVRPRGRKEAIINHESVSARELALSNGLAPVGVRPKLSVYIKEVFARREFLLALSSARARAENQDTYLGQLWTVLTPLLNSLVYVLIFGFMLKTRAGMDNVIGFIVVGTFMYGFFSSVLTDAAKSIKRNLKLLQSLSFPRILMPLSVLFQNIYILVPGFLVMMIISQVSIWLVQGGSFISPERWVLLIPAILLMALFAAGLGFVLARVSARYPDAIKFLPFIIRIGMYASGVIFAINNQIDHPVLLFLMENQPVAVFLNLARQAALAEQSLPLDWSMWAIGAVWAVAMFVIGFIVFWRDEARYGRD